MRIALSIFLCVLSICSIAPAIDGVKNPFQEQLEKVQMANETLICVTHRLMKGGYLRGDGTTDWTEWESAHKARNDALQDYLNAVKAHLKSPKK